ncbi:MAG TPA: BlaI/MecI/CopY family transcriptional regulator, partial [Planctomycetota bacterium]|nr:BlaI/MecI/CopY family transcriptional regulator [Planctomycetota bacterium]
PSISETEWHVMEALWARHPLTAKEVIESLESEGARRWHPRTVNTLLGRLVRKGAVGFERDGRRYLYSPLRTREQCVREETRSFLAKIFQGRAAPALLHFAEEAKLDPKEIERLGKLLEERTTSSRRRPR